MNVGMVLSALPWARRLWRTLPPPMRIPVLIVAAAVGLWYALWGRDQLHEHDVEDQADAGAGAPAAGRDG